MKFLIVLASLAAVVLAGPVAVEKVEPAPFQYSSSRDVDGSYFYSYAAADSSKTERREKDGTIIGGYKYFDDENHLQTVQYKAGVDGFQILASNLPVGSTEPVQETPEVAQATQEHFHFIQKALRLIARAKAEAEEFRRLHPELVEDYEHHE